MKAPINQLYSTKQISQIYDIPIQTLRKRCLSRGFKPTLQNGTYQYHLTNKQAQALLEYDRDTTKIPNVIYVHTTWLVLESKMNKK